MYARPHKLKVTFSLLLAMSIALSGFGDLALAGRCTDPPHGVPSNTCCANGCRCSQETKEPSACCCVKESPTPQPQPPRSGVNASPLELKLALLTHTAFASATLTQVSSLPFTAEARFFSPSGPSVRLLCCIWRI
jgi:hypothetical protein